MRTFAQILLDFADSAADNSTDRAKLREIFTRNNFDGAPRAADAAARNVLYPSPIGDEVVLRKDRDALERYDLPLLAWRMLRRRSDIFGTENPNPGVQRLFGLPTVMAGPPTVTNGVSNAGSLISGSTWIEVTKSVSGTFVPDPAAPFRFLGGNLVVPEQTINKKHALAVMNANGQLFTGTYAVEFMYDGQDFEFRMVDQSLSCSYRIQVDGQYVSASPTNWPNTVDGQWTMNRVQFTTKACRRIRLEFSFDVVFGGINVGPTDTVWLPSTWIGPKVVIAGDSYTGGTGANGAGIPYFGDTLAKLLGWKNVWASSGPGSGYCATGSGVKLRDRLAADVIAPAPDIVIICMGINDTSFSQSAVQTEATLVVAQLRAALPNVKLIVVGPWSPSGSPSSAMIGVRDGIKAAVATDTGPHLFVDNIVALTAGANTLGWITGTGNVGATTGSGNADRYTWGDAIHATQFGHDYLAQRLASAIAAAMPF